MISHDAMMRFVSIKGGGALLPSGSDDVKTKGGVKESSPGVSCGLEPASDGVRVKIEKPQVKTPKPPSNVVMKGVKLKQRNTFVTPKVEKKSKSEQGAGNLKGDSDLKGSGLLKELKLHKNKHHKVMICRPPLIKSTNKPTVNMTPSRQPQTLSKSKPIVAVSTNRILLSVSKTVTVSTNTKSKSTVTVSKSNPPITISKVTMSSSRPKMTLSSNGPHQALSTSGPHQALSISDPPPDLSTRGPPPDLSTSDSPPDLSTSCPTPDLSTSGSPPDLSTSGPTPDLSTSCPPNMSTIKEDTMMGTLSQASDMSINQPVAFVSTDRPTPTLSTSNEPMIATKSQPAFSLANNNVKVNNAVEENTKQKTHAKESKENVEQTRSATNIYKCDKCLKEFSYLKRFNTHKIRGNCDQKQFNCYQCDSKFGSAKYLISHVKRVHTKPVFQCAHCLKMFPTKLTVDKHIKGNHTLSECKLCQKFFKNKNTLASHIYNYHGKKSEIEVEATATETAENESNQREAKDRNVTEEAIMKIGEKTDGRSKSKTLKQTQEYLRECSLCKKSFHSRGGYSRHMKTHRAGDEIEKTKDRIVLDGSILKEGLDTNFLIVQDDQEHEVDRNDAIETFDSVVAGAHAS